MVTETVEQNTTATLDQFWKAVSIWNDKPHLVSRKICGALKVVHCKLDVESTSSILPGIKDALHYTDITEVSAPWVIDKLAGEGIEVTQLEENSKQTETGRFLYIKKLLPRFSDLYKPCLEVVIKDTLTSTVTFMGLLDAEKKQLLSSNFPYHFHYMKTEGKQKIQLVIEDSKGNNLVQWLKKSLFKKIVKWAESGFEDDDKASLGGDNMESSLNVTDVINFNQLYQDLKGKYTSEIMKIWPEKANRQKFVCEDVAVATYLLLLWEKEREKNGTNEKQIFVDMRCGNGLLVHILSSEGHPGKGIDIVKRKIWTIYPETTKLEVQAVTPSDDFLYPEADWLIGNHSDELTAWIPIIAARSSYKCKFFINFCCPYELNGQRMDSSNNENKDYMQYLQDVCKVCGFVVSTDRLRIPLGSGKKNCLVGTERIYAEEDQQKIDESIKEYIQSKVEDKLEVKGATSNTCQNWSDNLPSPRVDNSGTQLAEDIISVVTEQLLVKKRLVTVTSSSGQEKTWNAGGTCLFSELAKIIPKWKLKKLRSECDGLKALLRSHYDVFDVGSEGVCFRVPKRKVRNRAKEKSCWFQSNHPEGCPLTDEDCRFEH